MRAFFCSFPTASLRPHEVGNASSFEAITGQPLEMTPRAPAGRFSGGIIAAPEGSKAAWAGNRFVCDRPGRYTLTASNGSEGPIQFSVIAFPKEALDYGPLHDRNYMVRRHRHHPGIGVGYAESSAFPEHPRSYEQKRLALRCVANGGLGTFSDATFAAMTAEHPVPAHIDWSKAPT